MTKLTGGGGRAKKKEINAEERETIIKGDGRSRKVEWKRKQKRKKSKENKITKHTKKKNEKSRGSINQESPHLLCVSECVCEIHNVGEKLHITLHIVHLRF